MPNSQLHVSRLFKKVSPANVVLIQWRILDPSLKNVLFFFFFLLEKYFCKMTEFINFKYKLSEKQNIKIDEHLIEIDKHDKHNV